MISRSEDVLHQLNIEMSGMFDHIPENFREFRGSEPIHELKQGASCQLCVGKLCVQKSEVREGSLHFRP